VSGDDLQDDQGDALDRHDCADDRGEGPGGGVRGGEEVEGGVPDRDEQDAAAGPVVQPGQDDGSATVESKHSHGTIATAQLVDQLAVSTPVRMLPPALEALYDIARALTGDPLLPTAESPTRRVTVEASFTSQDGHATAYAMNPDHGVRGVLVLGGRVVVMTADLVALKPPTSPPVQVVGHLEKVVQQKFWKR